MLRPRVASRPGNRHRFRVRRKLRVTASGFIGNVYLIREAGVKIAAGRRGVDDRRPLARGPRARKNIRSGWIASAVEKSARRVAKYPSLLRTLEKGLSGLGSSMARRAWCNAMIKVRRPTYIRPLLESHVYTHRGTRYTGRVHAAHGISPSGLDLVIISYRRINACLMTIRVSACEYPRALARGIRFAVK